MFRIFGEQKTPKKVKYKLSSYRLGISLFFFVQGITFAAWASRIPDVKLALGLNDAELGSLLLAIPIGEIVASPVVGWLISRFSSWITLRIGFIAYPGALILLGLAPTAYWLAAALFVFGFACNTLNISINTQAVSLQQHYGRSIIATFHGMWSLGGFVGGLIGIVTANVGLNSLQHFSIMMILAMALAFSVARFSLREDLKKQPANDDSADKSKSLFQRFRIEKLIMILGFIVFGCSVCEGVMYDWSIEYFRAEVRPPDEYMRMGYVAAMSAMTLGRFISDRFVERYGAVTVIRMSGAIVALGLGVAVAWPSLVPATVGFFFVGIGVSSVVPLCYGMVSHSERMSAGTALAVVSSIGLFGFMSGPPIIGFISHASGTLRVALVVVAGFGLLTACLAGFLRQYVKRK